jgi:hypothetical protein
MARHKQRTAQQVIPPYINPKTQEMVRHDPVPQPELDTITEFVETMHQLMADMVWLAQDAQMLERANHISKDYPNAKRFGDLHQAMGDFSYKLRGFFGQ